MDTKTHDMVNGFVRREFVALGIMKILRALVRTGGMEIAAGATAVVVLAKYKDQILGALKKLGPALGGMVVHAKDVAGSVTDTLQSEFDKEKDSLDPKEAAGRASLLAAIPAFFTGMITDSTKEIRVVVIKNAKNGNREYHNHFDCENLNHEKLAAAGAKPEYLSLEAVLKQDLPQCKLCHDKDEGDKEVAKDKEEKKAEKQSIGDKLDAMLLADYEKYKGEVEKEIADQDRKIYVPPTTGANRKERLIDWLFPSFSPRRKGKWILAPKPDLTPATPVVALTPPAPVKGPTPII